LKSSRFGWNSIRGFGVAQRFLVGQPFWLAQRFLGGVTVLGWRSAGVPNTPGVGVMGWSASALIRADFGWRSGSPLR
jgi:hypothetical protein